MEWIYIYGTASLILGVFAIQVVSRRFDPFSPLWLFLVGYVQVYVVQAITYHDWAIDVRGPELVAAANARALWALVWFLAVYHCGLGRPIAALLPGPPAGWSATSVGLLSPMLVLWGLFCAGFLIRNGDDDVTQYTDGMAILHSFPFVMLVGAVLLIVTGRSQDPPRPAFLASGLAVAGLYVLIWMFNGKRSHSLMGVLAATCAYYVSRQRRPSWPVLLTTAFVGALAVTVAIGWRNARDHERSFAGFAQFVGELRVGSILENFDAEAEESPDGRPLSYETKEYGGFLLMMAAVPALSGYDYGANYVRIFSTFIPRVLWPGKPLYGREQWIGAWIAASELKRDETFTGPAIGILGATQLNGGAAGTAIVLAGVALLLRSSYEYFRRHATAPWVLVFWSITYFNSWFMVVADDPFNWFYYNWGFTSMPVLAVLWIANAFGAAPRAAFRATAAGGAAA